MMDDDVMCGKANKRCCSSSSRSIINLHDDILVMIFTRLSITTILRCKTLCKSFYAFLSSHYFAQSYLLNLYPPFMSLIVQNGQFFSLLELDSVYLQSSKSRILPDPLGLSYCGPFTRDLVGSCNGFFCFSDKDVVYVTNPLSSGAHVSLPQLEVLDVSKRSYGFGFCPQTQHYKVVELASYVVVVGRRCFSRTEVHVFTVGVDKSWRRIQYRFQHIQQTPEMTSRRMKFLEVNGKGALHWIVDGSDRLDYLCSFQINEEEVVPIPPPLGLPKKNSTTQLVGIHGCLCLLHVNDVLLHGREYEKSEVEFWCMKDYMDQDSWTLRIISQSCLPKALPYGSFEAAVGAWNNEEVLMIYCGNYLAFCFLETENITVTRMELPPTARGHGATCFVPNFFSYLEAGTTDEKAKDVAATRKLGSLETTQLRNGRAKITENILSKVPVDTVRIAKTYSMPRNTVQLILCDKDSPRFLYELKSDSNNNVKASQLLAATPSSSSMAKVTVLGSCNGLVCLSVLNDGHHDDHTQSATSICICNPLVQEVAILPQPQGVKRIRDEAYGFGFSSISGSYKVLRILTRKWHPGKLDAYVLTIGIDDKWRQVVVGGGTFRMPKRWPHDINKARFCDVTFNNAIHWIGGESQFIIYAFDIDEEQLTSIAHLPHYSTTNWPYVLHHPCLGISRDCLCVCLIDRNDPFTVVDLWTMRTYGSMASWTREKISIPGRIRSSFRRVSLLVTSWRDEEMLIWVEDDGGILSSYCLKEKRCTEIKIGVSANNETLITIPYVQSCLSLRDAFQNGNLRVNKMELPFKIE